MKTLKAIYLYDTTSRELKNSRMVDDNYVVQAGETEIKPDNGLYEPVTWNGTTWLGTDQAVWQATQDAAYQEYLKEHPEAAPQPTEEQQQLAELLLSNASQSALNAQLIKQVADLKAQLVASTTTKTQEAE